MRQVPRYLIIGNGRVARHFAHYFSLLKLSFSTWHRAQAPERLNQLLESTTHILLLISDNAIETFHQEFLKNVDAIVIHFSGSLISQHVHGAHPLMTFSHDLYTLRDYQAIPFIVDDDVPDFNQLLPGLANQNIRLNKSMKAKYHAMCVLGGNFSCLLWQKLFSTLETELQIPASFAHSYLTQQTKNLLKNPDKALTGPLIRGDEITLKKNIDALTNDPFQKVYLSFVECFKKISNEVRNEYS